MKAEQGKERKKDYLSPRMEKERGREKESFLVLSFVGRIKARRTKRDDDVLINLSVMTGRKEIVRRAIYYIRECRHARASRRSEHDEAV